jgi:hypothetical protein
MMFAMRDREMARRRSISASGQRSLAMPDSRLVADRKAMKPPARSRTSWRVNRAMKYGGRWCGIVQGLKVAKKDPAGLCGGGHKMVGL